MTSAPPPATPTGPVHVRTVSVPLLVAVAVGFAVAACGRWRLGLVVAGVALLLAGGLRVALPAVRLGAFVVRSRTIDAIVLLAAGGALVGVALSVPGG